MKFEHISVTGITCGGCVNSLTRALEMLEGVHHVQVTLSAENSGTTGNSDHSSGNTSVEYDENITSLEQIHQAVENAGFGIAPPVA